ncbi:hypothetical protein QJQ45_014958, partial [Haematococcus lacustris]
TECGCHALRAAKGDEAAARCLDLEAQCQDLVIECHEQQAECLRLSATAPPSSPTAPTPYQYLEVTRDTGMLTPAMEQLLSRY